MLAALEFAIPAVAESASGHLLLGSAGKPSGLSEILAEIFQEFREVHSSMLDISTHNKGAH